MEGPDPSLRLRAARYAVALRPADSPKLQELKVSLHEIERGPRKLTQRRLAPKDWPERQSPLPPRTSTVRRRQALCLSLRPDHALRRKYSLGMHRQSTLQLCNTNKEMKPSTLTADSQPPPDSLALSGSWPTPAYRLPTFTVTSTACVHWPPSSDDNTCPHCPSTSSRNPLPQTPHPAPFIEEVLRRDSGFRLHTFMYPLLHHGTSLRWHRVMGRTPTTGTTIAAPILIVAGAVSVIAAFGGSDDRDG